MLISTHIDTHTKCRGQIQDNTTSIITNTIITKNDLKFLYSSLCLRVYHTREAQTNYFAFAKLS